jgi:hypothetical protein
VKNYLYEKSLQKLNTESRDIPTGTLGANIINYGYFHVITGLNCAMKKIYKFRDKSTDIYNLFLLKSHKLFDNIGPTYFISKS